MKSLEFAIKLSLAMLAGIFLASLVEHGTVATGIGAYALAWILVDSWWSGRGP